MGYGLTILNESLFTQIDQDYKSLEIVQSGTVSLSAAVSGVSQGYDSPFHGALDLTGFSTPPLVFIKWGSSSSYVCISKLTNTRITFLGCNANSTAFSGGTLSYMLAMPSGSDTLNNFGLKIQNSSGETVFTSNKKYTRVVSLCNIDTTLNISYGPYGANVYGFDIYGIYLPNKRTGVFPSIYTTPYVCMSNSSLILGIYVIEYTSNVVQWGVRTNGAGVLEIAAISSDMYGTISCYENYTDTGMVGSNTAIASLPPFLIAT